MSANEVYDVEADGDFPEAVIHDVYRTASLDTMRAHKVSIENQFLSEAMPALDAQDIEGVRKALAKWAPSYTKAMEYLEEHQ